jgi:hypothetical protein
MWRKRIISCVRAARRMRVGEYPFSAACCTNNLRRLLNGGGAVALLH